MTTRTYFIAVFTIGRPWEVQTQDDYTSFKSLLEYCINIYGNTFMGITDSIAECELLLSGKEFTDEYMQLVDNIALLEQCYNMPEYIN